MGHFRRIDNGSDVFEPFIGDRNDADIGIDRAEGIIRRFGPGRGQGIEDGRFTDVWKADEAASETREAPPDE
jgi:hypothetical protein